MCWGSIEYYYIMVPKRIMWRIGDDNFTLSRLGGNTGNKGWYRDGIYSSEFAKISSGYGDGLLWCTIILEKQYKMGSCNVQIVQALEPEYDPYVVVSDIRQE